MLNDLGMHLIMAIEELTRAALASLAQAQVGAARVGVREDFLQSCKRACSTFCWRFQSSTHVVIHLNAFLFALLWGTAGAPRCRRCG